MNPFSKRYLALAAAFAAIAPSPMLAAEEAAPRLSLEQRTLLRCSAAFAIIAAEQDRGVQTALAYPLLQQRGKEYFVHAAAQLMDDLQLSREQIQALLGQEVKTLQNESGASGNPGAAIDTVMQPCLLSLEASAL